MSIGNGDSDEQMTKPNTQQQLQDATPSSSSSVNGSALAVTQAVPFDISIEPLLRENPRRFVIFPIQYQDIWEMYKKVSLVTARKNEKTREHD